MAGSTSITYLGRQYDRQPHESVLEALHRNGISIPFSCKTGVCQTCLIRLVHGEIPTKATEGLRHILLERGYFLACACVPEADLEVAMPDAAEVYGRLVVRDKNALSTNIFRLLLEPVTPLKYRAGQYINLRRQDGVIRSYSLASLPQKDEFLEVHVQKMSNGVMSNWLCNELAEGDGMDFQGPMGFCFYTSGTPEDELLLIGTGTGLAPLLGIVRDALQHGHTGPIHLYHGSHGKEGVYMREYLQDLSRNVANFHYIACLSGDNVPPTYAKGRVNEVALANHKKLTNTRVFLCGHPQMVRDTQKLAYLAGAATNRIFADPFDYQELRKIPRS